MSTSARPRRRPRRPGPGSGARLRRRSGAAATRRRARRVPLQGRADLGELALEPLAPGVGNMRETLGEHALRLLREMRDGTVELARETLRRVLPGARIASVNCCERASEKLSAVRSTTRLSWSSWRRSMSAKPAWIRCIASASSLATRSRSSSSRWRSRSATSCRPRRRSRSCVSSCSCAGAPRRPRARRARTASRARPAVRAASRSRRRAARCRGPAGFGVRHQLLLALGEGRQLGHETLLRPLEIAGELSEPLADALLDPAERLAEFRAGLALAVLEEGSALVGDPPLLGDELGEQVGARRRERAVELGGAGVDLGADERVEALVGLLQPPLDLLRAIDEPPEREHQQLEGRADAEPARGERELTRRLQREDDPGDGGRGRDDDREEGERPRDPPVRPTRGQSRRP